MKRLALLALCTIICFVLVAGPVSANLAGFSSVSHMKIHWDGSTGYAAEMEYAIAEWNGLGKVRVLPDTLFAIEEVHVSDVNRPQAFYLGIYTWHKHGVDTIQFNKAQLDGLTANYRIGTALHEWGHALGLADEPEPYNVMVPHPSPQTDFGLYDLADYFTLYPREQGGEE